MGETKVDRYNIAVAPGGLALVHQLINTMPGGRPPKEPDLLSSVTSAQKWLTAAVGDWARANDTRRPSLKVTASDLPRMRALREAIHSALMQRDGLPQAEHADAPLVAAVDVALKADGSAAPAPKGRTASQWLRSAVLAECLVANISGTWSRLKVCANPGCQAAFYDRSRNRSGVWHDVHVCGNAINLRASRTRRRSAAAA
jgi:predicted RNA-binding Zn ribbon-like protein